MPQTEPFLKTIFILALAGTLFSGYLSATKLFTGSCAFNETCPYFLGYPACWYGFGMYLLMFIVMGLALLGKMNIVSSIRTTIVISFLGILFAGRFAVEELWQSRITGTLGLSTCVYGLIFYILIFLISLVAIARMTRNENK